MPTPEAKKVAVSLSPGRQVNMQSELIIDQKNVLKLVDSGIILGFS